MKSAQFQVHTDVEDRHWWFVGRRRILLDVAAALLANDEDGALIVDVGCGTGANAAAMNRRFRCIGVDLSQEAVSSARARFPDTEFICGPAPDVLESCAARATLLVLMDVLEHIQDDRGFLADLVAAARPDARFLITVPADPRLWTEHDVSFGHFRRYVPSTLRAAWAGLPVEELTLAGLNTRLYPLVRSIRWLNRRRSATSGRAGTDFEMLPGPVNALLTSLFAGESRRLLRSLATRRGGARAAVSLLAVLRRLPDPVGEAVEVHRGQSSARANA